jgi:hypothetical protein
MNIKSDRDYIVNILEKVKSGEYSIPEFQRDFVWTTGQIMDLFDSMMKGYPIGALILWKPERAEFHSLNELEGISVEAFSGPDKQYVLDGRQRLTALISTLCVGGAYYDRICINLEDMQIINVPAGRAHKPNILGLGTAFDTYELVDYIERVRQSGLPNDKKKELADQAKRVNRILLSYELGFISMMGGCIDDAVEVFSRLNAKTTPISPDYMLQALSYQPEQTFLFAQEISAIKESLSKYNFENVDRKTVLKCVYHYLDVPFIDGKEQMILDKKQELPGIMKELAVDLNKTAQFLYTVCGVVDCKMIPYTYQFEMLALFFKYNRHPDAAQVKELRKWFFYTTYSGYFINTSLAVIREDIQRFRSYSLGEADTPIDYVDKDFNLTLTDSIQLRRARHCAMAAMYILHQYEVVPSNASLTVYVLPGTGEKKWGNTFFLLNKEESDELYAYLAGDYPWDDRFARYALSEDLLSLYRKGDYAEFIVKRQRLLRTLESHFIEALGLSPS